MDSFHLVRQSGGFEKEEVRRAAPSLAATLPLLGVIVQAWALCVGAGAGAKREEPTPSGADRQVHLDAPKLAQVTVVGSSSSSASQSEPAMSTQSVIDSAPVVFFDA